ncbi:MAG: hypothetical protein AAFZ18_06345 [Myxococcota bacterium]
MFGPSNALCDRPNSGRSTARRFPFDAWTVLEVQADFTRTAMFSGLGPMATVNVHVLLAASASRFGGRRKASY